MAARIRFRAAIVVYSPPTRHDLALAETRLRINRADRATSRWGRVAGDEIKGGTAPRGNASSSLVATRKQTAGWIVPSIGPLTRQRLPSARLGVSFIVIQWRGS